MQENRRRNDSDSQKLLPAQISVSSIFLLLYGGMRSSPLTTALPAVLSRISNMVFPADFHTSTVRMRVIAHIGVIAQGCVKKTRTIYLMIINFSFGGPRPGPAHQNFYLTGPGPARTINLSVDWPRPGPAHRIFQIFTARPGP